MLNIRSVLNLVNDSDLAYLFRSCVASKHVEDNSVYRTVASKTVFVPDMDDGTLNAYASRPGENYQIQVLGGLVNWVGHFAFIKTLFDAGMPVEKIAKMAEWTRAYIMSEGLGTAVISSITKHMVSSVKIDFAKYKVDSDGFNERWRSNLLDSVHACIAHELGHLCLGHCDTDGYDGTIMSSNRNIERQADLFSFSVLQCGTGVAAKSVGAVLLMASFFCLHPDTGEDGGTHPTSSERIENAIQSFQGIISHKDVDMIRKMVVVMAKAKKPKRKPRMV